MGELTNERMYVTYKWLFATAISIMVISLGFIYFSYSGIYKSIEGKADIKWAELRADANSARITALCIQLEKMESKQDKMLTDLHEIKGAIVKFK